MFGSSSIFVPVIWCNNAISIRNLLLIWKEIHFTGDWYNSWAETNRSEFCRGCPLTGNISHTIKIRRQAITKLNVADLFHFHILFQHNTQAHWRICPSVEQQKPGSSSCSQSWTAISISSLSWNLWPPKCFFSIMNYTQASSASSLSLGPVANAMDLLQP